MCMDLVENISEAEEDENRTYSEESDEFLPKSENTVPVTSRNIFGIIAILSILTLSHVAAFLLFGTLNLMRGVGPGFLF